MAACQSFFLKQGQPATLHTEFQWENALKPQEFNCTLSKGGKGVLENYWNYRLPKGEAGMFKLHWSTEEWEL